MIVSDKELGAGHPVGGFVYCNVGVPRSNKEAGLFLPRSGRMWRAGIAGARGSDSSAKQHLQLFWTEEATRWS